MTSPFGSEEDAAKLDAEAPGPQRDNPQTWLERENFIHRDCAAVSQILRDLMAKKGLLADEWEAFEGWETATRYRWTILQRTPKKGSWWTLGCNFVEVFLMFQNEGAPRFFVYQAGSSADQEVVTAVDIEAFRTAVADLTGIEVAS
jgi:hypothetical protein